jgi:hypothetical protein
MFVSYVKQGVGETNSNVGVPEGVYNSGGTSIDTFNYVGIMKQGAQSSLPLSSENQGFLGVQANKVHVFDTNGTNYNKFIHDEFTNNNNSAGDSKFIASFGDTILESKAFFDVHGNFNLVAHEADAGIVAEDSSPEKTTHFCQYWGMRFRVLNKGDVNSQMIKFNASIRGTRTSDNASNSANSISDPSMTNLKTLINGVGEFSFLSTNSMHSTATQGFKWNDDGTTAYDLPDSLFFYNAFTDLRPRIHAWAIKKIG